MMNGLSPARVPQDTFPRHDAALSGALRRRALLIGIDSYFHLPGKNLKGCQNDVRELKNLLIKRFGFSDEDIEVLINEAATQIAVRQAMARLLESTQTGDLVLFQFAGHGSRMTDREGNKPSGLDETIVPYDSGRRPNPNRDITDDEIALWVMRLAAKTEHIVLLFDCCHSATAFRDGFGFDVRSIEPDTRSVDELPSSPMDVDDLAQMKKSVGLMSLPSGHYVALTACQDEEKAHEYAPPEKQDVQHHGALTFFLLRALSQASGYATYRDVFEKISPEITARFPSQHPQLEGTQDRVLFNVLQIPLALPVHAEWSGGSEVTLSVGAVHGTIAGSLWELHPFEAKVVSPGSASLARVEASHVGAVSTRARLLTETAGLPQSSRAVEVEYPVTRQWSVELSCESRSPSECSMLAQVQESPWLRLANPQERARVRVYLVLPRSQRCDPVPQVAVLSVPSWLVVGEDGELIMSPITADRPDLVRANLERCVRHRQSLALENPTSRYAGQAELCLLRQAEDGRWERDIREVWERQRFAIEVRSSCPEPVYVALLVFNMDQSISQLYPPPGSVQRLFPGGKPLLLGYETDRALAANFPPDLTLVPRLGIEPTPSGSDYIKLFLMASPADFTPLCQGALNVRASWTQLSPLQELLNLWAGATATPMRAVQTTTLADDADWYCKTCELVIKRRMPVR